MGRSWLVGYRGSSLNAHNWRIFYYTRAVLLRAEGGKRGCVWEISIKPMAEDSAEAGESSNPESMSRDAEDEVEREWTRLKGGLLNCISDGSANKLALIPASLTSSHQSFIDLNSPPAHNIPEVPTPQYRYTQAAIVASQPHSLACVSFLSESSSKVLYESRDRDFVLCFSNCILMCGVLDEGSEYPFKPKASFTDESKTEKFKVVRFIVNAARGVMIAAGGKDGIVKTFQIPPSSSIIPPGIGLIGHRNTIRDLRPINDSDFLLSCSDDLTLRLWNYSTQVQVAIFQGIVAHTDNIKCLDVHYASKLVATGGMDRCVQLWTLDGKVEAAMERASHWGAGIGSVNGVRVARNRFPTELQTQPFFLSFKLHSAGLCALRFYHDLLISQDRSNRVCVWQPHPTRSLGSVILIHSIHVPALEYSKFGLHLGLGLISVGAAKGQVHIYSFLDLQAKPVLVTELKQTDLQIKGCAFTQDGKTVLAYCKESFLLTLAR